MINKESFKIENGKFHFKNDHYDLSKINNARVVKNSLVKHVIRIICIGLLTASVLLAITREGSSLLAPIGIIPGILYALITCRTYELQIEFKHIDETGLQWVTVTKSGKKSDLELFEMQVRLLRENKTV